MSLCCFIDFNLLYATKSPHLDAVSCLTYQQQFAWWATSSIHVSSICSLKVSNQHGRHSTLFLMESQTLEERVPAFFSRCSHCETSRPFVFCLTRTQNWPALAENCLYNRGRCSTVLELRQEWREVRARTQAERGRGCRWPGPALEMQREDELCMI